MPLFVYPQKVRNFHMYKAFQINVPVNSSCTHLLPRPRATAGHLLAFPVPGVGHLQILRYPGAGHLPTPGLFPRRFPKILGFYWKKQAYWLIWRGLLRHVLNFMHAFLYCLSSRKCIAKSGAIDVNQRFLLNLNQISVEFIWRTSLHISFDIIYNFIAFYWF